MSLPSASLAQIIENSFVFEIRSPVSLAVTSQLIFGILSERRLSSRAVHGDYACGSPRAKILSMRTIHHKPLTIDETPNCWFECLSGASALAGCYGLRCGSICPLIPGGIEITWDELLAGCRFNRFSLRFRCGFFPCARLLLSDAPFAPSRFGFWLSRRGRLPFSRGFAFLTHLLLVEIRSKLLISKTAAKAGSSNCQCSCDLNRPAARCHVPRTFV